MEEIEPKLCRKPCLKGVIYGLLSRICRLIPVQEVAPACRKGQFASRCKCGIRGIVGSPLEDKESQDAQDLCSFFSDEIAPALSVEPITREEIDDYVSTSAPRDADKITTLARAEAELAFGNRLTAYPLLAKAIRKSA